jgi:hypothetical protein
MHHLPNHLHGYRILDVWYIGHNYQPDCDSPSLEGAGCRMQIEGAKPICGPAAELAL